MRKVNLRMNEHYKYTIIKKSVEFDGNTNLAVLKLSCSRRAINRLIANFISSGKSVFVHGNRGRKPSSSFSSELKNLVISLYQNHFSDTNISHFCEILKDHHDIVISDSTVLRWLRELQILFPKAKKSSKRKLLQQLKVAKKLATTKKEESILLEKIERIDRVHAPPHRPRCTYFGERIQMDASSFLWFGDSITHLHVAIDDATGKIVGAYFDTQETLHGYYHVFHQILTTYGIPAMFFTDKRTVFEYIKKDAPMDDEDTFTQFSYACHQLGVDIKTSSVAQAKGRVERLNQTLQSQLPVELRLAAVSTIEEANRFLSGYISRYNEKFSLRIQATKTVFEKQPSIQEINETLAILSPRKIDAGHCVKYKNK